MGTAVLTVLAVAIGAVGAIVAATCRPVPPGRAASTFIRTIAVTAVASGVAMGGVFRNLFRLFDGMHLAYLLVVVSVPIVALGFGVAWWRSRPDPPRSYAVAAVALLMPIPLGLYATHIAPFWLRVDRVDLAVPAGRVADDGLRIGVLADLQLRRVTDYEHTAVERLMAAEPDLILIGGDFHQGTDAEARAATQDYRRLLSKLDAPGGVYAVRGDVDGRPGGVEQLVAGTGVTLLDDEVVRVDVRGIAVRLGGTRLDWLTPSAQAVRAELEATGEGELAVLLSHRPDSVLELPPESRIDLVVAGHTHGGQVALPVIGPPVTLSDVPRRIGAGGLHEVDGNAIYVSTGVGVERAGAPQVRFLTRPSVGIVYARATA